MQCSPLYNNSSDKIKNIIINLGSTMFNYLKLNEMNEDEIILKYNILNKNDMKDEYENIINELKNEKNKNIASHFDEMERQRISFEARLKEEKNIFNSINESLKVEVGQLKNKMMICENEFRDKFYDKYESEKDQLKKIHESEMKNKDSIIDIQNNKINPIIDRLVEKTTFSNSTEQGNYGEGFLDEIVGKGLSFDKEAYIDDSSKKSGSGDRIIRFKNGLVLMVEVKNENIIKKTDREQFIEHAEADFMEKKCDCALFLSLRTQQIPKKGKAIIPIYEGNMVYYGLNNLLELCDKKMFISDCIEQIYEKFKDKKSNKVEVDGKDDSKVILDICLENLNNTKIEYENIIKRNEKIVEEYKNKMIDINTKLNQVHYEMQDKGLRGDPNLINEKLYMKNIISKIKEWKEKEGIVFKNSFRKKIKEGMKLSELDKKMIEKIKLTDIQS